MTDEFKLYRSALGGANTFRSLLDEQRSVGIIKQRIGNGINTPTGLWRHWLTTSASEWRSSAEQLKADLDDQRQAKLQSDRKAAVDAELQAQRLAEFEKQAAASRILVASLKQQVALRDAAHRPHSVRGTRAAVFQCKTRKQRILGGYCEQCKPDVNDVEGTGGHWVANRSRHRTQTGHIVPVPV